ncbi:MAG: hypothetical protein CHACPFDD_03898 [Phycisphaerae bacterium]|nr:hypothetical protein [Phycisphaerae bacterium]
MSQSQCVVERIERADNLPSLPAVALKVLELTRSDDVSVEDLGRVIQNDPALASKLLKVVNSSMFGLSREVGSIKQAMVILGLRTVKVMALSFSLVEIVRDDGHQRGFDLEAYWRRSLTTAIGGRLLGKLVRPVIAEEAFVGGLLADIGTFAAWRCARPEFEQAVKLAARSGTPIWRAEAEVLGASHAELSRRLLARWNLPSLIVDAVAVHHGEGLERLTGNTRELGGVLMAAASIADAFTSDKPAECVAAARAECVRLLGIAPEKLDEMLLSLDKYVRETARLLSVQIGATIDYSAIQADALAQLAHLSMQTQIENSRLQQEKRTIEQAAATDALTRIANRAAFDQRLTEELEKASRAGHQLGLIMMDVDHFKKFNDTHGHRAGDAVLQAVADTLRKTVGNAGMVARYGGEEFAVIVAHQTIEQVQQMAEDLRSAIQRQPIAHEEKLLRVTASFGGAVAAGAKTPAQVIEAADKLLYDAKRNGRNRVECGMFQA